MKSPQDPKDSFLVEAFHLDPNEFFLRLFSAKGGTWSLLNSMNNVIYEMTKNIVGTIDLPHYNSEVVETWASHVRDNEWAYANEQKSHPSIFNHVRKMAKKCLVLRDNKPLFRIDKLETWQDISFRCGEDLFVASLLADMSIEEGYNNTNYQWDYVLKSDFLPINDAIKHQGLVENHSHLGGAQPMADVSWIYLMNYPFNQSEKFRIFFEEHNQSFYPEVRSIGGGCRTEMEYLVWVAARIRLWLFDKLCRGNNGNEKQDGTERHLLSDIKQLIEGHFALIQESMESDIDVRRFQSPFLVFETKVDYAITSTLDTDVNNSYLVGERKLMYHALRYIYQSQDSYVTVLFYLYLLIRRRFDEMFIQQNNKTGFQNFKEYSDRKNVFISSTCYYYMAQNMAIQGNVQENNLRQLELRTLPYDDSSKMLKNYSGYDRKAFLRPSRTTLSDRVFSNPYWGTDKFFYVMHFTKKMEMNWYEDDKYKYVPLCREHDMREQYKKQAQILRQLRDSRNSIAERILGIDAASNEVNFRPENFGPVFRYLSASHVCNDMVTHKSIPNLRRTFHVGEDFYDIVDGLRAIDEAVLFLDLKQGDRIGHGVALGIDVENWYKVHNNPLSMPKQNKLDNLIWMLNKVMEWNIEVSAYTYERIHTRIEHLFSEIHKEDFPGLLTYKDAWRLRGDDPEAYRSPQWENQSLYGNDDWEKCRLQEFKDIKLKPNRADQKLYKLYHDYHFDNEFKKRAKKPSTIIPWPEYIDIVKKIQIHMRSFILEKGIGVESCPSSNYLISNLDDFREIPTFNLFPIRESQSDFVRLNVCINTDDQGVFYTSLSKEYALLAGTLRKYTKEGVREYSDNEIMNWIQKLMDNGKILCFREI